MKKNIFVLIATTLFFHHTSLAAPLTQGKGPIATIDIPHIIDQLPETKKVQKELESLHQRTEKELMEKMAQLQKDYQAFMQAKSVMTEEMQQKKETTFMKRQAALQQEGMQAESTLGIRSKELLAPIQQRIRKAAADMAKKQGYLCVLNKGSLAANNDVSPLVIYSTEAIDLTALVLKQLLASKPTKKKTGKKTRKRK